MEYHLVSQYYFDYFLKPHAISFVIHNLFCLKENANIGVKELGGH